MVITVSTDEAFPLVKLLADVSRMRKGQQHGDHTAWQGRCLQFQRSVARLRGVKVVRGDSLKFACKECLLISSQLKRLCPWCRGQMQMVVV